MKAGRPRVRGNGRRQPAKVAMDDNGEPLRQRTSVDYRHKLDVIEFHERSGGDTAATVAHFYPTLPKDKRRIKMQLVSSWLKQRAKIQQLCESGAANQRNVRHAGQGATLPREVEEQIVEWMHAQAREGVAVTAKMLQSTARALASECGFEEGVFTASWSWRAGFLKRHFRAGSMTPATEVLEPMTGTTPALANGEAHTSTVSDMEQADLSVEPEEEKMEEEDELMVEEKPQAKKQPMVLAAELRQEADKPMKSGEESLVAILQANGLQQYLQVLQENGFETPESLAGIEEYFADLGVKLGHRKRFKDLSIRHTPGMDGVVPFVIVLVDIEARWGWSKRRQFLAKSVCQQWPKRVSVSVQNLFFGRISAHSDSTIEYASKSDEKAEQQENDEPLRCKGEVMFSTTLRDLHEAGYPIDGWKPFQHRLTLD